LVQTFYGEPSALSAIRWHKLDFFLCTTPTFLLLIKKKVEHLTRMRQNSIKRVACCGGEEVVTIPREMRALLPVLFGADVIKSGSSLMEAPNESTTLGRPANANEYKSTTAPKKHVHKR
jgi:hypothetical protein